MPKQISLLQTKFFNLQTIEQDGKKVATILVDGPIGGFYWWEDQTADDVVLTKERMRQELKAIAELQADIIIVEIDSLGGDVGHALSMAEMLMKNKAEVITDAIGLCASAGTILLQAGSTRRMSSNMMGLIHQAQLGAYGTATQMETAASDLKKFNDRIAKFYAKRSGKPVENFVDQMAVNDGYGEWNTPEELIAMGLIDEQYEPVKAAASRYKQPDKVVLAQCGLPALDAERKPRQPKNENGEEIIVLNQTANMKTEKQKTKNVVLNTKKLNELLQKPSNELTEDDKKFIREQKAALNEIATAAEEHIADPEEDGNEEGEDEDGTEDEGEGEEDGAEGEDENAGTAQNRKKKPGAKNNAGSDEIKELRKEMEALKVKNTALEAKVNKRSAGPINITDGGDPGIREEGRPMSKNERAAAKNAAALTGKDDSDDEEGEAPEKKKK